MLEAPVEIKMKQGKNNGKLKCQQIERSERWIIAPFYKKHRELKDATAKFKEHTVVNLLFMLLCF